MPKLKGVSEEVKEVADDEAPVIEETKTPPTAEATLAALQKEKEELNKKLEQLEKGYNTAQATLTKKDQQLKERDSLGLRIDGIEDAMQVLAGLISKRGELEEDPEKREDYKQEFNRLREERRKKETELALRTQQEEFNQKANTIYSEAELVFGDDVDALHQVRNFIRSGDIDLAEKKIAKAKKVASEQKVKTEEQNEAQKKKELEESGEWKTDRIIPAGIVKSEQQAEQAYISGKITFEQLPDSVKRKLRGY